MGKISIWSSSFAVFLLWSLSFNVLLAEDVPFTGPLVPREFRRTVAATEFGAITAVDVIDREKGPYHIQFITLDSGSLFLPVLLHADMVFYVQTGRGTVTWIADHDDSNSIEVERGDIYRIEEGSVLYIQSHSNQEREKLRIHAIFNTGPSESYVGAYSNISDLVRGFDEKVIQMGFAVSEEVAQGIKLAERPPPIVLFQPKNDTDESNWKEGIFEALIGRKYPVSLIDNGKKKKKEKAKTFNLYDRKPDVKNCNGWSIAVTSRDFKILRDSDIGVFMVNLTKGAMMGPHWNPRATEIAIVLHGRGMVQIICPSKLSGESSGQFECKNASFKVKEGDIFIVPRLHPMAQIAFNNGSLVFVGFTTMADKNHPQFLAGQWSVFRVIDRKVLVLTFNTANSTALGRFLGSQNESVMLDCTSCAEELERKIEEEMERKREEARKREEEEARRREEEEARKRQEEEEARRREEEEARRKEEEERKREEEQEEARRREEEEARKRQEEETKRKEEEARRKKEEEARREEEEVREREESRRREEEQKEARRREEEEEASRREEEEARKKEERRREEEEAREREEAAARREEEQEKARRKEKEEARKEKEQEEAKKRKEEEERMREEEEAREWEREEDARRQEEKEEARREEKEEVRRQEEEARREEEKEEARRREEEEVYRHGQEGQRQQEEATRSNGEMKRQTQQGNVVKKEGKRRETQQPMKGSWEE